LRSVSFSCAIFMFAVGGANQGALLSSECVIVHATRTSLSSCTSSLWQQCRQFGLHGRLDIASAFEWSFPARCSISKSYALTISSHLATCPSGFFKLSYHFKAPWSV
jgi:hypothetical protein